MYFKKVDLKISADAIDVFKLKGEHRCSFPGIKHFEILDRTYFDSIFNFNFNILPINIFFVHIHSPLGPHTDYEQFACLNYYINSSDAKTCFWEPKENAVRVTNDRYDVSTNTVEKVEQLYKYKDLIMVDSFVANNNDSYFLNISKIHSVEFTKPVARTAIQFQWDNSISYEELINKLTFKEM